jgi:membrane associated rhomboid family serine protease
MSYDLPPATRALLIANVVMFLLQLVTGDASAFGAIHHLGWMTEHLGLWPWGPDHVGYDGNGNLLHVGFRIWQVVSYGFLHGSVTHIALNMFALFMFGGVIEKTFGRRHFLIFYFVCLITAGLTQLVVTHFLNNGFYPTIGASGAIFGLLLAFGMLYPNERIMLIIPPIPMKAWVFVTGYGIIELAQGVLGTEAGVAHFAHLGGMLGGFVLIQYWRGKLPIKPRRRLMR